MTLTDGIGMLAAVCTTSAFAPQAWLVWKTRRLDGISLGMYCLLNLGIALWLLYGVLRQDWPLILANSVSLLLAGFILLMKIRHPDE